MAHGSSPHGWKLAVELIHVAIRVWWFRHRHRRSIHIRRKAKA